MDTPRIQAVDRPTPVDDTSSPDPSDPGDLIERLSDILVEIALTTD